MQTFQTTTPLVREIFQVDERTLSIIWTDDKKSEFDVVALRRNCPCAFCVDEFTGIRTLNPEEVSDTVRPVSINSVGRYALTIEFNDSHKTGIYTFKNLRSIAGLD